MPADYWNKTQVADADAHTHTRAHAHTYANAHTCAYTRSTYIHVHMHIYNHIPCLIPSFMRCCWIPSSSCSPSLAHDLGLALVAITIEVQAPALDMHKPMHAYAHGSRSILYTRRFTFDKHIEASPKQTLNGTNVFVLSASKPVCLNLSDSHTHTYIQTYIHTHTRTHAHAHAHTHAYTFIHT